MKTNAALALPDELHAQAQDLGARLARLRAAHHMRQSDAAARPGGWKAETQALQLASCCGT
jgi:hypothetical protein